MLRLQCSIRGSFSCYCNKFYYRKLHHFRESRQRFQILLQVSDNRHLFSKILELAYLFTCVQGSSGPELAENCHEA